MRTFETSAFFLYICHLHAVHQFFFYFFFSISFFFYSILPLSGGILLIIVCKKYFLYKKNKHQFHLCSTYATAFFSYCVYVEIKNENYIHDYIFIYKDCVYENTRVYTRTAGRETPAIAWVNRIAIFVYRL